jgi:hypothetical protein
VRVKVGVERARPFAPGVILYGPLRDHPTVAMSTHFTTSTALRFFCAGKLLGTTGSGFERQW